MKNRMLLRGAILIAALSTAGAASAVAVVLPAKANSHAVDSTSAVTTGSSSQQGTNEGVEPAATPSAAEAAAYGQCVAANAKTASENGGQGWNPTDGCDNANAGAKSETSSAQDGQSVAAEHASSHANVGLSTAAEAGSNGADNAAAQAGNAP
jgi:hypothetical protein